MAIISLSANVMKRCCVLPIVATAREPIKKAGYILANSNVLKISTCDKQPVHTFWHKIEVFFIRVMF